VQALVSLLSLIAIVSVLCLPRAFCAQQAETLPLRALIEADYLRQAEALTTACKSERGVRTYQDGSATCLDTSSDRDGSEPMQGCAADKG